MGGYTENEKSNNVSVAQLGRAVRSKRKGW